MGRFIVVGDVHGCFLEFEELIARVNPRSGDRIFQVGDLVNRGPDGHRCIDAARRAGVRCLLGNHEHRLLKYHASGDERILKDYDFETVAGMTPADWEFLGGMMLYHHEESLGILLVHAGFVPSDGSPWTRQPAEILTEIDVVDGEGRAAKRGDAPGSPPWADLWTGPPYVVYGHIPRREVYRREWSIGIDTACVYGGSLTAAVFPGPEIVQVQAKRVYVEKHNLAAP